jgi:hypothetical protein
MLSPSEQLLYSTVRIEAVLAGKTMSFGTGFYYRTAVGANHVQTLVTNKHVIRGADSVRIWCHIAKGETAEPSGEVVHINISLAAGGVVMHPEPDVDLCCISMAGFNDFSRLTGKRVFSITLESSLIPSDDEWKAFDALEEVVMIGCPNGLYDQSNGLPIFRRGITASHPSFHYNDRQELVIDAACFPGSSGSPVLLFNQMGYFDKATNSHQLGGIRVKLLGVLYAGPTIDSEGRIVVATDPKISFSSMMHLGMVIRSSRLLELDELIRTRALPPTHDAAN